GQGHAGELPRCKRRRGVERLVPATKVQSHVDTANRKRRTALAQRSISLDAVVPLFLTEGCDSGGRHLHKQRKELVVSIEDGQPFVGKRGDQLALRSRQLFVRVEELD